MNNEIKRKITSLTLMTIMLAGGMFAAVPSMVPAAHAANANLFVSAENSQFDNYMSGPQVIEVVVIDSDINDTDEAKGEPDVTVNGKTMRMVQGVDGNWYGYFADRNMASKADSTTTVISQGLDFGRLCATGATTNTAVGVDVGDTSGVAIPNSAGGQDGTAAGGELTTTCTTPTTGTVNGTSNVVREAKSPNTTLPGDAIGQIGLSSANVWPFIQLYTLNPTGNVVIQYNKGGGVQTTTLTFDTVDQFANASLDKAKYTQSSLVHVTVTDLWLNIDPTDEDSWTFGTNATTLSTNYQVFNENGALEGAGVTGGIINIAGTLPSLMVEDNGVMILNVDKQNSGTKVLTLQDNDDSDLDSCTQNISLCTATNLAGSGLGTNTQPVTITEQGPNSGIFGTFDESDVSVIKVTNNAKRGTSASVDYNETPQTVLVGFDFATIDIAPTDAEWTSGEEIPITLVDSDANKNSRADEDLDLFDTNVALIPALQTGDPFTLGEAGATASKAVWTSGIQIAANTTVIPGSGDIFIGNDTYALIASSTITNDPTLGANTTIVGNVALFPGSSITGFNKTGTGGPGIITGNVAVADATANNAQLSANALFNLLGNQTCTNTAPWPDPSSSVQMAALTLGPGVYCAGSSMNLAGTTTLTLSGAGTYIFKAGSTLTTVENSNVVLTNGANAANVFWRVGSSATLAAPGGIATSPVVFPGTIVARASISQTGGVDNTILDINGRLFALDGAITFASTTKVTVPGTSLGAGNTTSGTPTGSTIPDIPATMTVQKFSERAIVTNAASTLTTLVVDLGTTIDELRQTIRDPTGTFHGFNFLNLDVRSISNTGTFDVYLLNSTGNIITGSTFNDNGSVGSLLIADNVDAQSLTLLSSATNAKIFASTTPITNKVGLAIVSNANPAASTEDRIVADFFSYGFLNDGFEQNERIANQLIRFELEETGDNTSTFAGSLEFIMLNQLNILDSNTYLDLTPIGNDPTFIVIEDLDDEESPRVNYNDLGADGVIGQIADQEAAQAHSGVVSFDASSYKIASTVTVTLEDLDLNVDSDLIDIYTTVTNPGTLFDVVGNNSTSIVLSNGDDLGRLLDITFDDQKWTTPTVASCVTALSNAGVTDTGLGATGFTLVETGSETGIFVGDFEIPAQWCRAAATASESATGLDMEVNYVDFRDASGEVIEVGDGAGVRANTGSVSFDRTVYPVPFGTPSDFAGNTVTQPTGRSVFPIHQTGMDATAGLQAGEFITNGDLILHVRVNDPDFDTVASGEDTIGQNTTSTNVGPVKISVIRGSSVVVLGYAGGDTVLNGLIDVANNKAKEARQFGPMSEIAPDAGIFESDIIIRYTDGPSNSQCPTTLDYSPLNGASPTGTNTVGDRFDDTTVNNYCILQGDILQVEYTDPADASGDVNTVTDSATFDLRNGVLQSDKSVYIIGSDMILTLIEPDFDLDNDQAETYDLDLIEWDSDAATVTMGDAGGSAAAFDPEPFNFRETGDSTGIFQIVIEIPNELDSDKLERGEEIVLEYSDWGPSGSDFVGDEDEDVNLTIFTSNFGATVELDQKVYTWTDKVYITIVAPDHNFDSNLVDEIGNSDEDPLKVSTRGDDIDNYKLVETGTDTGIFTGEVILTGFTHDADGDTSTGDSNGNDVITKASAGNGPTDGLLTADDDDGITVSFEFSEDETIVGSALIRWNIGEVQWLEASYPASGTGVVRVIDPDMNLNPESVDNFVADVWSDSDAGGIDLTVTETNEATGIFEGTVFFTVTDESSGHRLRVAEGDTVTAEYEDNTLPNPYTTADELDISATSLIGTVVPPLERAPAANLRTVDAFGNSLSTVSVDQQVQITADLANGQDREQAFAYLVQIQDGNGVTVSLAWITGSLSAGQSFSPALSWIPTEAGTYTATAFVWESVDNPTALSPPVSTTITVQ